MRRQTSEICSMAHRGTYSSSLWDGIFAGLSETHVQDSRALVVSGASGHDWTIFILSRFGEKPRPTGWSETHSETGYWVSNGRLGTRSMTYITDLLSSNGSLSEFHTHNSVH